MLFPAATSGHKPVELTAYTVGPEVGNRLRGECWRRGQVEAVFSSAAYVSLETGLLCVTRDGVDLGPFSVATSASRHLDFKSLGIAAGQDAYATSNQFLVSGVLKLDLRPSKKWSPPAWPGIPDTRLILSGIVQLRRRAPARASLSGIGRIVIDGVAPENDDMVGRASREAILAAGKSVASIDSEGRHTCNWARRLIGVGPGLTPSGDDFLGGFLIALHAIGKREAARRLWVAIGSDVRESTNSVSVALLESAAKGLGSAGLHAAIFAIMAGENSCSAAASLSRSGHTSGWDALAGAVVALEAFAANPRRKAA